MKQEIIVNLIFGIALGWWALSTKGDQLLVSAIAGGLTGRSIGYILLDIFSKNNP